MLQRNFLTANELQMSEKMLEAHITVLGMLEREELTNDRKGYYALTYFSMENWSACIWGHVGRVLEPSGRFSPCDPRYGADSVSAARFDLYYPKRAQVFDGSEAITVPQAAHALRNFLTTGKAQWAKVLAEA